MALTVGTKAPSFELASSAGGTASLATLRGERFVLYFYPKDNTPGCTQESCDFRDNFARLQGAGVRVFGVSKDSIRSHEGFRGKYRLPFPLLSDPDSVVAKAYGAFGQKMMYGKPVVGTIRSTFLIGADGKIEAMWSPVKVAGHVDAVLAAARGETVDAAPAKPKAKASAPAKKSPVKKVAAKKVSSAASKPAKKKVAKR